MGRGCKVLIAAAATSGLRDHEPLAYVGEIMQQLAGIGIVDHGSDWYRQVDRLPFPPAALAALAMAPTLGSVLGIKTEMQ